MGVSATKNKNLRAAIYSKTNKEKMRHESYGVTIAPVINHK
jgi:hypothetical protein